MLTPLFTPRFRGGIYIIQRVCQGVGGGLFFFYFVFETERFATVILCSLHGTFRGYIPRIPDSAIAVPPMP